jgi:hypothetical protein
MTLLERNPHRESNHHVVLTWSHLCVCVCVCVTIAFVCPADRLASAVCMLPIKL